MTRSSPGRRALLARVGAAVPICAIGILHLSWAAGSPWPASSGPELADAVIGGRSTPSAGPTVLVGATLLSAGVMVGAGRGRLATAARGALGAALLLRAAIGGTTPALVLGVADPSATFRRWDRLLYRPLCGVLGALSLAGIGDSA